MGDLEDSKFVKLRKFNVAMGFLHLIQSGLMLFLSTDAKQPINITWLRVVPDSSPPIFYQQVDVLTQIPLGPMVASFLLLSAIAHFSVASPWGYPWYVKNLKKGINPARWYEYAASSSIMVVLIASLCGIWEFSSLVLMFSLNATMNLFGMMMEKHNQTTQKTDWTSFIYGSFAGLMVWIVLGVYFFGSLLQSTENVPDFLYGIFFSIAIFFNIFAVNMILQYRAKGKWADYLYGEKVYIILSLTAKSALAWQVFAGTAR